MILQGDPERLRLSQGASRKAASNESRTNASRKAASNELIQDPCLKVSRCYDSPTLLDVAIWQPSYPTSPLLQSSGTIVNIGAEGGSKAPAEFAALLL
jgi:hypothetical protein